MRGQVFLLLIPYFLAGLVKHVKSDYELLQANETEIEPEPSNEPSITSLERVLFKIGHLTSKQKLVWEQQNTHQKNIRTRKREKKAIKEEMYYALKNEQHLLKEMFGTLKRRIEEISSKGLTTISARHQVLPRDCADLYEDGEEQSGVYKVWPTWSKDKAGFYVYCDMDTDGGGWTVIHRWGVQGTPTSFFRKSWEEYKNGFGDLNNAFWLGNTQIYALISQGAYELRFDLNQFIDESCVYKAFWIESESNHFTLHVEGFGGSGEDIFSVHNGAKFSTFDMPGTDGGWGSYDCNSNRRQGWWFKRGCTLDERLYYFHPYSYTKKEMKIKPGIQRMKEAI